MVFTNESPLLQFANAIRRYHKKIPSLVTEKEGNAPATRSEGVATLVDGMAQEYGIDVAAPGRERLATRDGPPLAGFTPSLSVDDRG